MENKTQNLQNKQSCGTVTVQQPLKQVVGLKVAKVVAIFCIAVALSMLASHFKYKNFHPLDSKELSKLKQKLVENPKDENLKIQIRELDLQLRQEHERHIRFVSFGKKLILGGAIVFLASIQIAFWKRRLCVIKNKNKVDEGEQEFYRGATVILLIAAAITAGGFALVKKENTKIPEKILADKKQENAPSVVSLDEYNRNWTRFRGPFGNGVSLETNLPVKWDVQSGMNVMWKTQAPSNGFNSPIVWDDKIFMSGGGAEKREVFCYSATDGRLLWQTAIANVPGSPPKLPEVPDYTGYAAATMATDGQRAFVIFANNDLAALDFNGKIVWSKYLGEPKNPHGHAASLITWQNLLIVQLDQGEQEDKLSKLYAFDSASGKVVWQTPRPVASSWATPLVFTLDGETQIATLGLPYAISYSVTNGQELWRYEGLSGEVTPSPVFAGGKLIFASPADKLVAVDPKGRGDITKTKVLWTSEENVPDITSPVATQKYVFTITTMGMLTCHDTANGKKLWEHDFQVDFHASPTLAGENLYLIGQKGEVFVVRCTDKYEEISNFKMDDRFHASPAVANGKMYLRGEKFLYCIGSKPVVAGN
ncbi:MAG: PQQ-binding-like beta-propeller repeat protein [Verrucomicrobiae bacterium]|nr:PQQ-binding-like beta-propeller repeat protein [Verrucomicrobiae bacterium]